MVRWKTVGTAALLGMSMGLQWARAAGITSTVLVAPTAAADGTTLPSQRHLLRLADGLWVAVVQQQGQGSGSTGLEIHTSPDDGMSWTQAQTLQGDPSVRDTADLVADDDGAGFSLLYSVEPESGRFTVHNAPVVFAHLRESGGALSIVEETTVFSPSGTNGYFRATLARDAAGRLYCVVLVLQDTTFSIVGKTSANGGVTWSAAVTLATLPDAGGARVIAFGNPPLSRVAVLYDDYAWDQSGFWRTRAARDPDGFWTPAANVFPDGLYHGGAFSAVATPDGHLHLGYHSEGGGNEDLRYLEYNGNAWSDPLVVDPVGWWSNQPALTAVGNDLFYFWNHESTPSNMQIYGLRRISGVWDSAPTLLDGAALFKGYTTSVERVSPGQTVRVAWSQALTENDYPAQIVTTGWTSPGPISGGDAGTDAGIDAGMDAGVDAGSDAGIDAGTDAGIDAGAADAGTVDGGTIFADAFERTSGLGPSWKIYSGKWSTDGHRAVATSVGYAVWTGAAPADQIVSALVLAPGGSDVTGVLARASSANNGYGAYLNWDGSVGIERRTSGHDHEEGSAALGLDPTKAHQLTLTVTGTNPVRLRLDVDGVSAILTTDTDPAPYTNGAAGIYSHDKGGAKFDNFSISSTTGSPTAPPPSPPPPVPPPPHPPISNGFAASVAFQSANFDVRAVGPDGTAYAVSFNDSAGRLYASTDNARSWSFRGTSPGGATFGSMTALADDTLLAHIRGSTNRIARSTNSGATWTNVLTLGTYEILSPHSIDELGGVVYLAEYQTFSTGSVPLRLWQSNDHGATWSVNTTFSGHRHAHAVRADLSTNALWVFFGDTDPQCGLYRSLDRGATWKLMLGGQQGDVVDGTFTSAGLLFGQDISYLPPTPTIALVTRAGVESILQSLPGPSYSTHALSAGGFLVGVTREPDGDIYAPGEVSAHLFGSADGNSWKELFAWPRIDANDYARADVYWELPSGEAILQLWNVQGPGKGYEILKITR